MNDKNLTYKDLYPNLSPIETRLFEEGYWEVGFVDPQIRSYGKIIKGTEKWNFLTKCIFKKYGLERTITYEMIIEFMDELKAGGDIKITRDNYGLKGKGKKRVVKKRRKDGTIKEYIYYD